MDEFEHGHGYDQRHRAYNCSGGRFEHDHGYCKRRKRNCGAHGGGKGDYFNRNYTNRSQLRDRLDAAVYGDGDL
jgi:hypothetical protein